MSDFERFATVINNNNVRMSLAQAVNIYEDLDLPNLVSNGRYYRDRADNLQNEVYKLESALSAATAVPQPTKDRAELLKYVCMHNDVIIDSIAQNRKIQAIKELRSITGCHLREGKDAVEAASEHVTVKPDDEALAALRKKLTGE